MANKKSKNYDLIGDIHGHAEVLRRLLRKMDYHHMTTVSIVIRIGKVVLSALDFVDRGPEQRAGRKPYC